MSDVLYLHRTPRHAGSAICIWPQSVRRSGPWAGWPPPTPSSPPPIDGLPTCRCDAGFHSHTLRIVRARPRKSHTAAINCSSSGVPNMKFRQKKVAVALACAMGVGTAAYAQQPPQPPQQAAREKVEVTATSIKRVDAQTALPVQVITRDDIPNSA